MSMTEDPVSFLVNSEIYCSPQPFVNVIRHYVMLNHNQVSEKPRGERKTFGGVMGFLSLSCE